MCNEESCGFFECLEVCFQSRVLFVVSEFGCDLGTKRSLEVDVLVPY